MKLYGTNGFKRLILEELYGLVLMASVLECLLYHI